MQEEKKYIYITGNQIFNSLTQVVLYVTDNRQLFKPAYEWPQLKTKHIKPDTEGISKYELKTLTLVQAWKRVDKDDPSHLGFDDVYEYETEDDEDDDDDEKHHDYESLLGAFEALIKINTPMY